MSDQEPVVTPNADDGVGQQSGQMAGQTTGQPAEHDLGAYWRRNLLYLFCLLGIWFLVSYVFGILLVDQLNQFTLLGSNFKLGFWFAQQGSIYVFVVLIFVYVWLMNRLDRSFGVDE